MSLRDDDLILWDAVDFVCREAIIEEVNLDKVKDIVKRVWEVLEGEKRRDVLMALGVVISGLISELEFGRMQKILTLLAVFEIAVTALEEFERNERSPMVT